MISGKYTHHDNIGVKCGIYFMCLLLWLFSLYTAAYSQEKHYTLQECVAMGLKSNNDVVLQRSKVEEARYKYYQQLAAYLPQIDASLAYKKYDKLPLTQKELAGVQKIGSRPPFDDYIAGLVLNQVVFSGSKWYQIKALKSAYDNEMMKMDLLVQKVKLQIAKAFYEQLRSTIAVKIQSELSDKLQEQRIVTELLYKGGKLTNIDFLKIQTQLASSLDVLENLKNLAYSKALMLGQVMGIDEPVYAQHELTVPDDNFYDITKCSTLPRNHPELEVARLFKEKSDIEKDQAYSTFMPTIYFNANYYREESRFFPGYPNWYIGFIATMPIFHGGSLYTEVKQAYARYDQAYEQLRKTEIEFGVKYQVALATLKDRKNRIVTTQKTLDLAREALTASELKYKTGKLTTIELLDAHIVWNNAYLAYMNGLIDFYIACEEMEYFYMGRQMDKEEIQ